jgi:hypothetical protein
VSKQLLRQKLAGGISRLRIHTTAKSSACLSHGAKDLTGRIRSLDENSEIIAGNFPATIQPNGPRQTGHQSSARVLPLAWLFSRIDTEIMAVSP